MRWSISANCWSRSPLRVIIWWSILCLKSWTLSLPHTELGTWAHSQAVLNAALAHNGQKDMVCVPREVGKELRERPSALQWVLKDKCKFTRERRCSRYRAQGVNATKAWELPGSVESISACFLRVCMTERPLLIPNHDSGVWRCLFRWQWAFSPWSVYRAVTQDASEKPQSWPTDPSSGEKASCSQLFPTTGIPRERLCLYICDSFQDLSSSFEMGRSLAKPCQQR